MARPRLRDLRHLLSEPANEAPRAVVRRRGAWMLDCGHGDCAQDDELAYACAAATGSFVRTFATSGESALSFHPAPAESSWPKPPHPEYIGRPLSRNRPFRKPFTLTRVRLDGGGYDRQGRYWGIIGQPLWRYHDNEDDPELEISDVVRGTREEAKRKIRVLWPNARFYR